MDNAYTDGPPASGDPSLLSLIPPGRGLQVAAGLVTMGAGFVHALAGESHFSIWWGYGLFFAIVSICQLLGGAALFFWRSRGLYWTGIAGTAVILALYVLTRTVGVPFGPEAGEVERIGLLDFISKAFELSYLALIVALLRRSRRDPSQG